MQRYDTSSDNSSTDNCTKVISDDDIGEEDLSWDVKRIQVEYATCNYSENENPILTCYLDNEGGSFRPFLSNDYLQLPKKRIRSVAENEQILIVLLIVA